jgi:hypothetical protein
MKTNLSILKQLSPNCREAMRLYSQSLEGPLPLAARTGLRMHLMLCKWCRRCSRQTLFLRSACGHIQNAQQVAPHFTMPEGLRTSLKDRLRSESEKNVSP